MPVEDEADVLNDVIIGDRVHVGAQILETATMSPSDRP